MELIDKEGWEKTMKVNDDPYGSAGVGYAEKWASLMEAEMINGKTLEECADETSHKADEGVGITGFMFGCAVGILSKVWKHGEELRRWHNLKTQIGNEGK